MILVIWAQEEQTFTKTLVPILEQMYYASNYSKLYKYMNVEIIKLEA